jgi:hypothetical protein
MFNLYMAKSLPQVEITDVADAGACGKGLGDARLKVTVATAADCRRRSSKAGEDGAA